MSSLAMKYWFLGEERNGSHCVLERRSPVRTGDDELIRGVDDHPELLHAWSPLARPLPGATWLPPKRWRKPDPVNVAAEEKRASTERREATNGERGAAPPWGSSPPGSTGLVVMRLMDNTMG
uniref:Uncharacterized protein n=1 Tax=Oryza sativa subsp. japonica TaxID=39947 RepID=Q69K04_ORYSJ|nr:hypothetical protein [Oryza sativa Japonica Group]BAD36697.1 hypothetical protein [Oryza sativa Japonica Group]